MKLGLASAARSCSPGTDGDGAARKGFGRERVWSGFHAAPRTLLVRISLYRQLKDEAIVLDEWVSTNTLEKTPAYHDN